MKILHVNYSDAYGGASIAVKRLHDILNQNNIDSSLLVSEKKNLEEKIINIPKNSEKIKNLLKDSLNRKLSNLVNDNDFKSFSLNLIPSKLINIINKINPDIVNLHWIGNETISIKDIKKIKSKVVWTMHDMWPFCATEHYTLKDEFVKGYKLSKNKKIFNLFNLDNYIWNLKKNNYGNIDKIICTSEWMYEKAKKSQLFKNKKMKIIPLPIDQNFWKPVNRYHAKEFLGINKNQKIIVFGADNFLKNKRKGFEFLVKAVDILKKENKFDYKVLTFGETKNLNKLKSLNIENLGYINDDVTKKILYSAADLTVIPSIVEAFGLVAQESIQCGTPCVIFNDTGLTSIIEHKKNGYIANNKSEIDLKDGIEWCIKNINKDENNIHELSKKKFNSNKIINSYIDFLNS